MEVFPSPSKGEGQGGGVFKNPLLLSSSRQGRREGQGGGVFTLFPAIYNA